MSALSAAEGVPRQQAQDFLRSALLQLCVPALAAASSSHTTLQGDAAAQEAAAAAAPAPAPAGPTVQLPADVATSLAASFTGTLLQHYNLWVHVFTQEQAHVQHQHHLMVSLSVWHTCTPCFLA
jgi:hypothetical protein